MRAARARHTQVRRVAMLSVHTSPLDQPGSGDAGGLNVYVVELSRRLAARGVHVEVFTRATASDLPPRVELTPGVDVHHVTAGPFEGLDKDDLPAQLCAFASGVLRAEAHQEAGYFDVVHSHYWLSGQVGWLTSERWGVPLVHTFHTLGKVKNAALARRDAPEPRARLIGEEQVVAAADRLVASTADEARQLVQLYGADPTRVSTVAPGVDLDRFRPGDQAAARVRLGLDPADVVLVFVGRIQPLKAPDLLLGAAAQLLAGRPGLRRRLRVLVVGGPSGNGRDELAHLTRLAAELGISDLVRLKSPAGPDALPDYYRAATAVVVPSHNESFGLVALEAQACGTPVVAASVGGLPTAVRHGVSGLLVSVQDPRHYADAIASLVTDAGLRARLAAGALRHAARFSWDATADGVLAAYREGWRARSVPLAVAR